MITLVYRGVPSTVHSIRFFWRSCGISAAWLPSVPCCDGSIVYLCLFIVRLRSLCRVGGRSFFCAIYGFVSVAWCCDPALCCLASRFASREVPLLGFYACVGYLSCVFPVASALVALPVPAQVLVVALRSVAKVAILSPNPRFCASFADFCSWLGNFHACA